MLDTKKLCPLCLAQTKMIAMFVARGFVAAAFHIDIVLRKNPPQYLDAAFSFCLFTAVRQVVHLLILQLQKSLGHVSGLLLLPQSPMMFLLLLRGAQHKSDLHSNTSSSVMQYNILSSTTFTQRSRRVRHRRRLLSTSCKRHQVVQIESLQ